MIIKRNREHYSRCTALYISAACMLLGINLTPALSAEPFQILDSDLTPAQQPANASAQPFQMLASDTQAGKTTTYQGTDSAGDAEITNNAGDAVYFNDQSTAAAAVIINNTGGTTRFNDQSTAASAFITNNADAQLSFHQDSTAADARITNNGGGSLSFNDHARAGSAVITNNGTASFNDSASADNALITNNATGTLNFNDQSDAGRRNIYNNGQIRFADQSSAKNSLIDNNQTGSIEFSDNSSAASGNINNSGRLTFTDESSAAQAAIVNNQTGTIRFGGNAGAADATITNNGSTGFAGNSAAQDARLINNADANLHFQDQANAGSSMIVNAGDLTFSDRSSAETATILTSEGGTTRFQDHADGVTSQIQIDQNARLDVSRMANNQLAIGALSSAGSVNLGRTVLTAQDKIVLNESSRLNLVLGYGQLIAQDVELQGGALEIERAADLLYALGETYRIIDAPNLSGSSFSPDINHDFAFATPQLSTDGTGVVLEHNTVQFASAAQTNNQTAVANALESLAPDSLPYRVMISGSQKDASYSFDQLSGEIHATTAGAIHDNSSLLRLALMERARQVSGDEQPRATAWQSWLTINGALTKHDGDSNTASARLNGYSATGGVDYTLENDFTIGLAGSYEQNKLKISDRSGTADISTLSAGLYGAWVYEGLRLRSGAAYQHHSIDTDRNLALPMLNGQLESSYNGWTGQIFAEAGYRFDMAGINLEPYGRISYIHSRFDRFQEYGLGDTALSGTATALDSTIGTLGIIVSKRFLLDNDLQVNARFEAAWNRNFGDRNAVRQLAFSSGLPFDIAGTSTDRNSLLLDARLSFWRPERLGLDIIYSGLLGSNSQSHRFGSTATLRF